MNTNIEVLRELDELVEAARLLGATQAKRGFGCHTDEDRRFELAMYESIDKHRAALCELLAERDALARENEAMRRCAIKYLGWLGVTHMPLDEALREDMSDPTMCGDAAIAAANGGGNG